MASQNLTIDYIEFTSPNIIAVKKFFTNVFNWKFTDYGPDYTSFEDGKNTGGFAGGNLENAQNPLIVLYSSTLNETKAKVIEHGGKITKDTFSFPGGVRFHFTEPSGLEFAVWSEAE